MWEIRKIQHTYYNKLNDPFDHLLLLTHIYIYETAFCDESRNNDCDS